MARVTIDRAGFDAKVREQIQRAPQEAKAASLKAAQFLQRRLRQWSPKDRGKMQRNIVVHEVGTTDAEVTIPRKRFPEFYYPIRFTPGWRRTVRRNRRAALLIMRDSILD